MNLTLLLVVKSCHQCVKVDLHKRELWLKCFGPSKTVKKQYISENHLPSVSKICICQVLTCLFLLMFEMFFYIFERNCLALWIGRSHDSLFGRVSLKLLVVDSKCKKALKHDKKNYGLREGQRRWPDSDGNQTRLYPEDNKQ